MPTKYETKVDTLKNHILKALENHADASAAALEFLEAAAPACVSHEAGTAVPLKPPTAAENALLYNALIACVLHLASQAAENNTPIMSLRLGASNESAVAHLLDAALWLAVQTPPGLDPATPAACVEAVVEVATNAECDGVFAYLDSRLGEFKRIMQKSHHALLRTCNLLLKRLSKSQEASLCGRVLMFLAKFLPLTERSGVNLSGAFHSDNATPVEEVAEGALDAEGQPVDVSFYKTFWGLQHWFADPPAALPGSRWSDISRGVRTVLDKFASVTVTVSEAPAGAATEDGAAAAGGASVKYLSSARLLPLQLRDATFRRQFLIQCLVLMTWVEKPLLKDWAAQAAKGRVLEDIESLRARVYDALEATPEKGREFAAAIRFLMNEEDAWAVWKQAGCPAEPLKVAPVAVPSGIADAVVGPPRKRPRPSPEAIYGIRLGNAELDTLWNLTEDNLSTLGADDRGGFRTLRQLMEPVIEEMNEAPGEGDDDALKASKNVIYSWKTLRMVARDSLPAFAAAVRRGGDLTVAARALYPDEVPPEPEAKPEEAAVAVVVPAAAAAVEESKEEGDKTAGIEDSQMDNKTPVDTDDIEAGDMDMAVEDPGKDEDLGGGGNGDEDVAMNEEEEDKEEEGEEKDGGGGSAGGGEASQGTEDEEGDRSRGRRTSGSDSDSDGSLDEGERRDSSPDGDGEEGGEGMQTTSGGGGGSRGDEESEEEGALPS